ncbi:MAG: divergent polysaccharide deacetylase family protein [Thermoanaerobaculia bacterium]
MARSKNWVSRLAIFFVFLSLVFGVLLYRSCSRKTPPPPAPAPSRTRVHEPRRTPAVPRDRTRPAPRTTTSTPPETPERAATSAAIAILIDDLGNDAAAVDHIARWPFPVSVAVLPELPASGDTARTFERSGKQVLLHLPMEPRGFPGVRPGPGVVLRSQSDEEIASTLQNDLDTVPGAVGVNNHMGSAATADLRVMRAVAGVLAGRGLFFVDSRTTGSSVALEAAREARVPSASRRVFLDDIQKEAAIEDSLSQLISHAKREGPAIAIGHPYPTTLAVLDRELPRLAARGVRLVTIGEVVK